MMLIMELLQYLGLISYTNHYFPCPDPYQLAPCKCNGEHIRNMEMQCYYAVMDLEDLKPIFADVRFPVKDYELLEFTYASSFVETENVFGDLAFQVVQISGDQVRHFYMDMFQGSYSSLRQLKIRHTNISDNNINWDGINKFTSLESLLIDGNKGMTKVPTIVSDTIQALYLSENYIKEFPINALVNVPNLQTLSLRECYLTDSEITSDRFSHSKNLAVIILQENQLTKLTTGNFGDMPSLMTLDLSSNGIMSIEAETFALLPNLEELDLEWNQITIIVPAHFSGLSRLTHLKLGGNGITTLNADSFKDLRNCNIDLEKTGLSLDEKWARPLFENGNQILFESTKDGGLKCDCDLAWLFNAGFNKQMRYWSSCQLDGQKKFLIRMTSDFLRDLHC